jgi:hypothetical protein
MDASPLLKKASQRDACKKESNCSFLRIKSFYYATQTKSVYFPEAIALFSSCNLTQAIASNIRSKSN